MATGPKSPAIVQLFAALQAEKIRFILAGMSAANLQGVLASTVDVDVWIGLPAGQYIRVIKLCQKLKATITSANKIYLSDDTPVDFIYEIHGLQTFEREYSRAKWLPFHGLRIPVMPLERISKSKEAIKRDKDKLHIVLIQEALKLSRHALRPARKKRKRPTKG